jgi:CRISPR/Cas system-associated endoribonuclease Cas2
MSGTPHDEIETRMPRRLVLCAYDVVDDRRLARALAAVTGWSHGGQRSAFECFAARDRAEELASAVGAVLLPRADRLALFRPEAGRSFALGIGKIAVDRPLIYVG